MIDRQTLATQQKQLKGFCVMTIALFFIAAFLLASPQEIWEGMKRIVVSRDALITDYFKLASYGAAFFNGGLMLLMIFLLLHWLKMPFTGLTLAAFFINAGFALFGKNLVSSLPILIGTYLYARHQGVGVKRYIYTGLFGTCLAPLVTEMIYVLPFSLEVNLMGAVVIGIVIGFILPALAMHTASMHLGYTLFNVGFAAGILGFVLVCIMKGFGINSEMVMIWKEGRPDFLIIGLYGYFLLTFLYGLWCTRGKLEGLLKIFKHPGRAVADFILMDGMGNTLMNMALAGMLCTTYILLIGGDLSGPVVGGILTVFGFAAFGVHLKNYIPCLLGVYLCTALKVYEPTMPSIQLAAMFSAGLAPISGQFGILAGILSGVLHTSIVSSTGDMYSGLNLYNNGFSTGFVAIIMIPLLESFIKRFNQKV